jgi:hypothetical protein
MQCVLLSAALTSLAAAHISTLQARSSSRRVASTLSSSSYFHASACRPSLRQAAARQFSSLGSRRPYLGHPSCLAMRTLAQRTSVARTLHEPSNYSSVLAVSSRSHSSVRHISHDRLYSNSTHPHCRSPAGPRAVSPARLLLVYTDAPPFCVAVSNATSFSL